MYVYVYINIYIYIYIYVYVYIYIYIYIYIYVYIYIYIYIYIYNAEINNKEVYFFRNLEFHAACTTIFSRINRNGQICYNIIVSYFT